MIDSVLHIVSFCSGVLSSMGLGGGGILIIYLTLFSEVSQIQAQGINLIFFAFISLVSAVSFYIKKLVDWPLILPAVLLGPLGALLGFYLSSLINPQILSKIFGALLILVGITQLIKSCKTKQR